MITSMSRQSSNSVSHVFHAALMLSISLNAGCMGGGSGENYSEPEEDAGFSIHWDEPRFTVAGTCATDLLGYEINLGLSTGNYTELRAIVANTVRCTDTGKPTTCGNIYNCSYNLAQLGLSPASWYIAIQVYDKWGNRSALSNEVTRTIIAQ